MKKIHKIVALGTFLLGISNVLDAQTTIYDANRWMGSDLNGTARFVGMGGAMGALGGDISTMGTNPAGIGIYRSNDAMVSFGFVNTGTKDAGGAKVDKFFGSFDNAGVVISSKIGHATALRYVNFGFNYHRRKSFDRNMLMNGVFESSQTEYMAGILGGSEQPLGLDAVQEKGAYENPTLPWIGLLGFDGGVVKPMFKDAEGNFTSEGKGTFAGYFPYYEPGDKVAQQYTARERGGIHSYDFNVAFNFYDRFYLGATVGAYNVDYDRTSLYKEDFTGKDTKYYGGYDLGNEYWVDGSGIDFKLGFIWRPIESSSFRIGAAIHTPTFFSLTEHNHAYINSELGDEKPLSAEVVDRNGNPMDGEYKYSLVTPWKFNVNMGYTIGSVAALGFEYEYQNYSTAKLKDEGVTLAETEDIKSMMKAVHTIRVGAEFKLAPEFAFRVGYNHITPSMKSDAFKWIPDNSIRTDTEYANPGATDNYTLGLGYRGEFFYVDMAYQYNTYKEEFYAFDSVYLNGTSIRNNNHKVLLTVGMRF